MNPHFHHYFLSLIIALACATGTSHAADDPGYTLEFKFQRNYGYLDIDSVCVVSGYTGTLPAELTIPSTGTIDGKTYPVEGIGDCALGNCETLEKVNLPNTLKIIFSRAFSGCASLQSVTLPDSVLLIDVEVFYNCSALRHIELSKNLKQINDQAFGFCESLEEITFPDSLEIIMRHAFVDCHSLKSVFIPKSVRSLDNPFPGCKSLTEINVDPDNPNFKSCDGVLFSKSGLLYDESVQLLMCYPAGKFSETYIIPAEVTNFDVFSFRFSNIRNLVFPDELDPKALPREGKRAFWLCDSIKTLTVGPKINNLIPFSMMASKGHALEKLIVRNYDPPLIDTVLYNNEYVSLMEVGKTQVIVPKNAGAQYRADSIWSKFEIIESDYNVPCPAELIYEMVDGSETECFVRGYYGDLAGEVVIPETATVNGAQCKVVGFSLYRNTAFAGNTDITRVSYPECFTGIPGNTFEGCTGLVEFKIGKNFTHTPSGSLTYAFGGCTRLKAYTIDPANTELKVVDGVVYSADGTTLSAFPPGRTGHFSIPSTVTKISPYAFYRCAIGSVDIPASVTVIPQQAFYGCSQLESVTFHEGLTTIEAEAFAGCTVLKSIRFPESLTSLYLLPFRDCDALESVTIGKNLTSINGNSGNAFHSCRSLKEIKVDKSNPNYSDIDGVLFDKKRETLLCFPSGRTGEYTMPASTTGLGIYAFSNVSINSLRLSDAMEDLGYCSFRNCTSIKRLTLGRALSSINESNLSVWGVSIEEIVSLNPTPPQIPDALVGYGYGIFDTRNTKVRVPMDYFETYEANSTWKRFEITPWWESGTPAELIYEMVDGSETECFVRGYYGDLAGEVVIPETATVNGAQCKVVGFSLYRNTAFAGNTDITRVSYPECFTGIPGNTFEGCTGLVEFKIGKNFTHTPSGSLTYAFGGCTRLKAYTIDPANTELKVVDGVVYSADGTTLSAFPPGRTGHFSIPSTVTKISPYAFYRCAIGSVDIPASVTVIPQQAFYGCSQLESVTFHEGLTTIEAEAFAGCTVLKSIRFPESLTSLYLLPFRDCDALESVTIGKNLTSINGNSGNAFHSCRSLKEIKVDKSNPNYSDIDGVLFDKKRETLLCFPSGRTGEYTMPASTTGLGIYAFSNVSINSLRLSDAMEDLGYCSFRNCTSIKRLTLGRALSSINESNLSVWGVSIEEIVSLNPTPPQIPDALVGYGYGIFDTRNTKVRVPMDYFETYEANSTWKRFEITPWWESHMTDKFTYEANDADYTCSITGTNIEMPSGVLVIPETISINGIDHSVMAIADNAFAESDLTELHLPATVTAIGDGAFSGNDLKKVELPDNVERIGYESFAQNSGLKEVLLGQSLSEIGEKSFAGCPAICSVISLNPVPPTVDGAEAMAFISRSTPESDVFDQEVYENATLTVPESAIDAYRSAPVWRNFVQTTSGMDVVIADPGYRVITSNGIIMIGGLEGNERITVYDPIGNLLYRGCSPEIRINRSGIVILNINGHAMKLKL